MQINNMTLIIGGDAGQGVESSGAGFCKALARGGLHVVSVPDFHSRIRGGHNFYLIKISENPIASWTETVHLLVAFTPETVEKHRHKLVPGSAIVYDSDMTVNKDELEKLKIRPIPVPLIKIVTDTGGNNVMVNTAALGAVAGLLQFPIKFIQSVIKDNFKKKGSSVTETNLKISQAAYDYVTTHYGSSFDWKLQSIETPERMVINGNQAISLGALLAGCNFVSAYPMTPGTSIFEWLTAHANTYGIVSKQAEDEIAAICMGIGAAHVGARALVPTSGGGFSLMVEALGLAGMSETPIVIVIAQRPGPSTGFATRTEQADLLFAIHASQGEFPRIILAPGNIQQCFEISARAFNLAEKYQTPVIIMTDAFLANSFRTIEKNTLDFNSITIDRGQLLNDAEIEKLQGEYRRHLYTDSGISERVLPGHPMAIFKTTSDEHNEDGEIVEDADTRNKMHQKRMRKLDVALSDMNAPIRYGPEKADITFICWGSTVSPLQEAITILNSEKTNKANVLQFVDLWPFPVDKARPYLDKADKLIAVEGNYTGQLAKLIKMITGIDVSGMILKYDGRPFSPEYIINKLKEVV